MGQSDQFDSVSILLRTTDGTDCSQVSIASSPLHRMSADCRQAAVDGQQVALLCVKLCIWDWFDPAVACCSKKERCL